MGSVLIRNGRVWDGNKFTYQDILTQDDIILKTGEAISDDAEFVFDAEGKTVSAGLVDLHVHMNGAAPRAFGIHGEMSCFPFGVTAANDAGSISGDKALLDSFMLKNTVFVCTEIKNNHAEFSGTEKLLKSYGDKAVGIKVYFDASSQQVTDITPLKEACAYAHEQRLRVMVHCSDSPVSMAQIVGTLGEGDILTHAFHGGVNSAEADGFDCFRLARSRGVVIDAGFAGHIHTDFGVFQRAVENGFIPDTISTDITRYSAYKRGGKYGMTMCMSMARLLGMEEADIFRAVTSTPAKALGREAEWGCLETGRKADITVLEYSDEGFDLTDKAGNRISSAEGYRCVLTVSDGEIIYRR